MSVIEHCMYPFILQIGAFLKLDPLSAHLKDGSQYDFCWPIDRNKTD